MDKVASDFFDDDEVLARTERLVLRRPVDDDLPIYIACFAKPLRREYRREDEHGEMLRSSYWEGVSSEEELYCTVVDATSGEACGYCSIEKLRRDPSEISVRLLPEWQGKGLGTEAVAAFMEGIELMAGPTDFIAEIEWDNEASQRLFRRLGFVPAGVDAPIFKNPDFLRSLEGSRPNLIDDRARTLADEFGVEPGALLSHVLVFRRDAR